MLTKDFKDNFIVCYTGVVDPTTIDARDVLKEYGIEVNNQFIYLENNCLFPPSEKKNIDKRILRSYIKTS